MNIRVRVLNVTHVQPAQTTNQPRNDAMIKLSPFDTFFLALGPPQMLFFYDDSNDTSLPPFPSLVSSLRVSLGTTLAVFTPFAGKLTACSEDHDVLIDCSPDAAHPGVRFVEAEYSGDAADMRRLARDVEHDTEAFLQLVPELEVGRLPAPVFAVQVTRPADGGGAIAVGVVMHHAVADGQSLWQFMRAWSTASQEGSLAGGAVPTFDRASILRHPKAEAAARNLARFSAPELPKVNRFPDPDWRRQSQRTYLLTAGQIESLKRRILQSQATAKNGDGEQNHPLEPPTTFVAIASLLWTSIVRARSVNSAAADDVEYFMFPADCRRLLRPPLEPCFFGNCVKARYACATTRDLVCRDGDNDNDNGLARAAAVIRRAVRKHLEEEDPMGDADRWLEIIRRIPRERLTVLGASNRFMMYEVDFGWGQPSRVEIVSLSRAETTTLLGAPGGAVQVSVMLHRDHVDTFKTSFLSQVAGHVRQYIISCL